MDAIQKIKAEIERKQQENLAQFNKGLINIDTLTARDSQLLHIHSFIESLEKEQNVDNAHPSAVKSRFLSSGKERKIIKEMYKDRFDDITPNRVKYLTFLRQVELDARFYELDDILNRYGK